MNVAGRLTRLEHAGGRTVEAFGGMDAVSLAARIGFTLDPWQRDVLVSPARQKILLCCRQSGKSTVASLLALHKALSSPASLTLLIAKSFRQALELSRKVRAALSALTPAVPLVSESTIELRFANGARILSLPNAEQNLRGYSADLVVIDEASRCEDSLYMSCRPMIAVSGGDILLLSTPFGARGFFYETWTQGGEDWQRVKITSEMCPRISAEWLAEERRRIGEWWYAQEYDCQFTDAVGSYFRGDDIARAFASDAAPLFLDDDDDRDDSLPAPLFS